MSKASNRIDGTAIESPVNRQENAVSLLYTNKAAKSKNEARTELQVSHQENAASHTRMSTASIGTSNAGVESMVYRQENNISRIHTSKTSGDINGTATDTMMNQPEQSWKSRNTLLALEREIKARERKVGAREKLVDQREKDLALKHTQYETARTCIIGYEARIKELENSKDEGNCRILLTTFDIPDNHLCIINCYLPSSTSPQAISKYREDVDVLYELIVKYYKNMMFCFNEDHFNRKRPKETLMKELIEELGLKDLGTSTASESTYINHNLGHASHMDHALIKSHMPDSWNPVEVSKEDKVEMQPTPQPTCP